MSHGLIRTSGAVPGVPHKTALGAVATLGRQVITLTIPSPPQAHGVPDDCSSLILLCTFSE
jgi:hypothetical protein